MFMQISGNCIYAKFEHFKISDFTLCVFQPCTETLFLSLFKEYRLSLSGVLLQMVQEAQGPCPVDDFPAILRKDAGRIDTL